MMTFIMVVAVLVVCIPLLIAAFLLIVPPYSKSGHERLQGIGLLFMVGVFVHWAVTHIS